MDLLTNFSQILDSGDPEIMTWALVNSYYTPFLLSAAYLLTVTKIGPALMRDREPIDLRIIMVLYNAFVVGVYLSCLAMGFLILITTDVYRCLCYDSCKIERVDGQIVGDNIHLYIAGRVVWVLYILKYLEFADTLFFVLRKKSQHMTRLHLIHHSSLPILCWMLLRSEISSFLGVVAFVNASVHALMYTYYGLAALGPVVREYLWWKKYLTLIQISQFFFILIYVTVLGPLIGCKATKYGSSLLAFFTVVFIILFYDFYNTTYLKSRMKAQKEG